MLLISVVLFAFVGSLTAQIQTDLQKIGISGKASSVTETIYELKESFGNWIQGNAVWEEKFMFDQNGNMTEEYSNSSLPSKTEYSYDERGNRIEGRNYSTVLGLGWSSNYFELSLISLYKHDNTGSLIEEIAYSPDGKPFWTYQYTYDDKGNLIERYWADVDMEYIAYLDKYTYDNEGNMVTNLSEDKINKYASKYYKYTYDEKGNKTTELIHYVFDIERKNDELRAFSYEYDDNGNWIKMITSKEVTKFGKKTYEPWNITIREITYY